MQNKNKNQLKRLSRYIWSKKNRITAFVFIITVSLKVLISGGALFFYPKPGAAAEEMSLSADNLVILTNEKREGSGLLPLSINHKLTVAALKKAQDILQFDYFAHTTPSGKPFYKWIQEERYQYKSAGENLAIAFDRPESIVNAWMNSPAHRDNIIDSYYQEIGIAVATGEFKGDTTTVVVQLFGDPLAQMAGTAASLPLSKEKRVELLYSSKKSSPSIAHTPPWKLVERGINVTLILSLIAMGIMHTPDFGKIKSNFKRQTRKSSLI